ncbi:MAG: GMC family oxidoreductase N-terminal domain-containing protein [Bacillota bacterium]
MTYDADVIVIGAGGGGAVAAKELGERGIEVLVLEAGPWYGNKRWPEPNREPGARSSNSPEDLDQPLLARQFSDLEFDMNDGVSGKFRWGPADRRRSPWARTLRQQGLIFQNAGVGGTTLHYLANSPRAYPAAIEGLWPISYRDLIPYYEKAEHTLPVRPAPTTAKEELFYYGARKAGWSPIHTPNVTEPGYRPQPNAILLPDPRINDPEFEIRADTLGCTLRGHCVNGCYIGPSVDKVAKRSTLVSYIPLALKTGKVTVRPNTFVTRILTEPGRGDEVRAVGVRFRDTWTGEHGELRARTIVMAGGGIETPRLWLNSELPYNPWVGRGMTNHFFDWVTGVFDQTTLTEILGPTEANQHVGQNSGARFDYPGLGMLEPIGFGPGMFASLLYSFSQVGYAHLREVPPGSPWDLEGRVVGEPLKALMAQYRQSMAILISTDDDVDQRNGVFVDPTVQDEHGPVPQIHYQPTRRSIERRDRLAVIAAEILRKAGARQVIRGNWPPAAFIHMESTMRMGYVTDTACEALQVKGLFIADNSAHSNAIGGPNPTLTTQALATIMADKMAERYF